MKHRLQTLLKHKLQWLVLLTALLGVSHVAWGAQTYYYSGQGNGTNWTKTAMTVSSDGYYEYYKITSNTTHQFKIGTSSSQYAYNKNYVTASFNGTNVSEIGDYGGDNCYCWKGSTHYILVYYPNTKINTTGNPIICASTTLPTDGTYVKNLTKVGKDSDKHLGDKISGSSWYYNFEIGQDSWTESKVCIGIGTNSGEYDSYVAGYYAEGEVSGNKRVRADIKDHVFKHIGKNYAWGRVKQNTLYSYTDALSWTNTGTLTLSTSKQLYWEVSALPDPTSQSSTASGTTATVSWTHDNTYTKVLVVRYEGANPTETAPTNGTSYTAGSSAIGDGTVIYNGTNQTCDDTDRIAGTTYTYYLYTNNNNYYSSGVSTSVEIPSPCTPPSAPTDVTASPITICTGSSSTLSATVASGCTLRWYTVDAGQSGDPLASNVVSPTANTTYYAEAYNGTCASSTRTSVTVSVNATSNGGSIANANACSGSNTQLNVTGITGSVIKWQEKADGDAIYSDIENSASSQIIVAPTVNTSYKAIVQNGVCPQAETATPGVITVNYGSIARGNESTTFDAQYLDAAGTTRNFTYTISCGATNFRASVTAGSDDYSVGDLSVAGSTLTVPVTFRPSTHGTRNGTVTITYDKTNSTTSTETLNLTGTGKTLYVVGSAFDGWSTFNPMSYDRTAGKYHYRSESPNFGSDDGNNGYKILLEDRWNTGQDEYPESMYKDANWTFSKTGMDSNCAIGAYDNGRRNNSIIGSLESSDYTTPVTLYVTANTSTITAAKTLEVKAKLDCTVPASAQYPITGNGTVTYNGTNSQSPTITPAEGAGNITSTYYTGTGGTSYTESTTVPTNAGTYTVTVDVNKGSVYCSATKLTAGTFTISKKAPTAGDFNYGNLNQVLPGDIVAVSVTKKDGINGMGTVNNIKYAGNAQLPTAAGTYAVTFDVSAGTNYTSGEGISAGNLVISKSSQTTPTVSDMTTCDTGNYTLSATGGESSGYYNYTIVFGGSGTATISYNSTKGISTLNVTDRGTVKIKVLKLGDANYEDSGWSDVKEFNFVAAPTVLELTNPRGEYTMCSNGSITLKIADTQSGYTYQLYQNGVKFGDPVSGGGDKTFDVDQSGIYTAKAYYGSSESSCLTDMDGTITLNISTTPILVRSTPETTNYAPVTITSINSDIYKWQVKDKDDNVVCDTDPDDPVPGTTAYLYDQTATSVTFKGASSGSVYEITATTKAGCPSEPAEIEVNDDTPCN